MVPKLLPVVLSIGALCAPGASSADPGIAAAVDVRLTTIEVHAADAFGHPIDDLGRDDFLLFEDGKPVELGAFEAPAKRPAAIAGTVAPPGTEPPRDRAAGALHVAIFIDNTHLFAASRFRALAAVRHFLRDRVPAGAEVSLVTLDTALQVRVPFTTKVGSVLEALAGVSDSMASLVPSSLEQRETLMAILDRQKISLESALDTPCPSDLLLLARQQAETDLNSARSSFEALAVFVNSLVSLPGRKIVLHVSDGVPLIGGMEAWGLANRLCDGSGARSGMQWAVDVSTEGLGDHYSPAAAAAEMQTYSVRPVLDGVIRAAVAHGVEIYTLLARGPSRGYDSAEFSGRINDAVGESDEATNLRDTLTALAHDTGGIALLDRSDLDGALDDAAEDLAHVYVLGFYPTGRGDDRVHRLEVRSKRPGARLRYAQSYRDASADTLLSERVLAALIQRDSQQTLGVELAAERVAAKDAFTILRVNIPLKSIAAVEQGGTQRLFSIFVALRREDGSITPVRSKMIPLSTPRGAVLPAFYRYELRLDLPLGAHTAAVAVRDDIAGTVDLRTVSVKVSHPGRKE